MSSPPDIPAYDANDTNHTQTNWHTNIFCTHYNNDDNTYYGEDLAESGAQIAVDNTPKFDIETANPKENIVVQLTEPRAELRSPNPTVFAVDPNPKCSDCYDETTKTKVIHFDYVDKRERSIRLLHIEGKKILKLLPNIELSELIPTLHKIDLENGNPLSSVDIYNIAAYLRMSQPHKVLGYQNYNPETEEISTEDVKTIFPEELVTT